MPTRLKSCGAVLLALLATPALADPPVSLGTVATATNSLLITLTVPKGGTGAQTLSVTYAGDVGAAGQSINVLIDGGMVGNMPGGSGSPGCVFTYGRTIALSDSVYTAAASDGIIEVRFVAVGTLNNICENAPAAYGPPFTVFNGGSGSRFAVTGSLSVGSAPVVPGAAGSPETQQSSVAATRGTLVLSNAPDANARIQRLSTPGASRGVQIAGIPLLNTPAIDLDIDQTGLSFSSRNADLGATVWAEVRLTDIDDATSTDQSFSVLHFGADWHLSRDTFIGIGVQADQFALSETASGDQFDADGWMIGPVVTHRLRDDLYFNGRLAFGTLSTDVARSGGGIDQYDSDRRLVELGLIGSTQIGAFTLAPHADIGWYRETSDAYTSGTLGAVAATEITVEHATLGARLSRDMSQWAGTLTPFVGGRAAYTDISEGAALSGSLGDAVSGWSGNLSLGAQYQGRSGLTWSAEVEMGGIGTQADTLSASFGFNLPF